MDQAPEYSITNPEKNPELLKNQMPSTEYLARLSEEDQSNLMTVNDKYKKWMMQNKKKGCLIAVGGTLKKPLPRKDIDILVLTEPDKDQQIPKFSTIIENSISDFNENLKPLVGFFTQNTDAFRVKEIVDPTIDEEFENPNILRRDGSICIEPKNGTLLEFIRYPEQQQLKDFAERSDRNWVLLATA